MKRKDINPIAHELFNTGEHTGFRKSVDTVELNLKEFLDKNYYGFNGFFNKFKSKVRKYAKSKGIENLVVIYGCGYDGSYACVVFFDNNPYKFKVFHSWHNIQRVLNAKTIQEAVEKITDFC